VADRPGLLAVVCGTVAAAAVALALWMLLSAREDPPPVRPFTWPTVVRTVDGLPSTVQPEDLGDR